MLDRYCSVLFVNCLPSSSSAIIINMRLYAKEFSERSYTRMHCTMCVEMG